MKQREEISAQKATITKKMHQKYLLTVSEGNTYFFAVKLKLISIYTKMPKTVFKQSKNHRSNTAICKNLCTDDSNFESITVRKTQYFLIET